MGKIKQGILGGFLGKVGSVVGGNFKGIATIRAMPLSVANPRTPKQVQNRIRFKGVAATATSLGTGFLQKYWNRFAVMMSGYNLFVSVNKDAFNGSGQLQPDRLYFSKGVIEAPSPWAFVYNRTDETLRGQFEYPITGQRLETDIVNIVVVDAGGIVRAISPDQPVTNTTIELPCALAWQTQHYVYIVTRREDGTKVSGTNYRMMTVTA